MAKSPETYTNEAVDRAMRNMAVCPFCGCTQGQSPELRFVRVKLKMYGERWFYVSCWICGAEGPTMLDPVEAVNSWNKRITKTWTPLGPQTYLLPEQKYGHLLVNEGLDTVKFIDYIEEEISAEKDGIQAEADIDLGRFRICEWK